MKTVLSDGGPLIGLDRSQRHLWGGIYSKTFIGEASPFASDYEAAGHRNDPLSSKPWSIAKITGVHGDALVISMPCKTAVVSADPKYICIAQAEFTSEDWSFDTLTRSDFDSADYSGFVEFESAPCEWLFFDAAASGKDDNEACIGFELPEGQYIFSSVIVEKDPSTQLISCRIIPK